MYGIVEQGNFTSDGNVARLDFVQDVDWIRVINMTTMAAGGAGTGVEFYWQRGMAADTGIEYIKLAADDSIEPDVLAAGGFTLFNDGEDAILTAPIAITGINGAAPPLVTLVATAGLNENDVVRFVNVPGAQQFGGVDFTIDTIIANTSFELPFAPTIVATGAVAGNLRRVVRDPLYYPRRRYVSAITVANPAVVTLTVAHDYNIGEIVRLQVPDAFDMVEMNGIQAEITAIDLVNNTITLDTDSSAFTAFAWPLTADVPFTPAQVVPVGDTEQDAVAATENQGEIGIRLAAGVDSPAGVLNDEIYWIAGKSVQVNNNI